jgi:acyl-CoA dehydrogenase
VSWHLHPLTLLTFQGMPSDAVARAQMAEFPSRWGYYPKVIDDLKEKAKKLGLWNIFLSKTHYSQGAGFTNLEYGMIAMILGKSSLASEVRCHECGCTILI